MSSVDNKTEYGLTSGQKRALDYILQGKNVFLTGPSGTGKSTIINIFRNTCRHKRIGMTSTTGVSALLLGGSTIHSYLGIGLGDGTVDQITKHVAKNKNALHRWKTLEVLIIDEISMLSPTLFDKLEHVARVIRGGKRMLSEGNGVLFGGIQLILTGDFLQLPVVGEDSFCFEAKSWSSCIEHTISLTEIVRQDDIQFQTLLNNLRFGKLTEDDEKILNSRIGAKLTNENGIKPTRIFTTNSSVDSMNNYELDKLEDTECYEYEMTFEFHTNIAQKNIDKYRKNCLAPEVLQLCKGAQVMLLSNLDIDNGLVNGSRGVVINFVGDFPLVKFLNGSERVIDHYNWLIKEDGIDQMSICQLPLKLAWAITVHKSQGATLDYAEIDLRNTFTYGQAYVALSRVKSISGLSILGINYKDIKAHPKCISFYNELNKN